MLKMAMIGSTALLVCIGAGLGGATPARASVVNLGSESNTGGMVIKLPGFNPTITIGSDGESAFEPFGVNFDVSDAIQMSSQFVTDPGFAASFGPADGWIKAGKQSAFVQTWALPASSGSCGSENERTCEPIAKWDLPGTQFADNSTFFVLFEPDGKTLSDVILAANNGPGGEAAITFSSDPNLLPIPIPAALPLFFGAIGGVGAIGRWRKRNTGVAAA